MKILFRFLLAGLLIVLIVTACIPFAAPANGESLQGKITVSGAFALYPLVLRWSEEFQKVYPGVKFDIAGGGAGKGMEDILAQKVDIGMVSREITPEEETQGAYPIAVAKDAVFPMISEQNPVLSELLARGVTRETLTKIFITGEVRTWGQVVGKTDITDEIHVYTRSETCGAAETWGLYLGGGQADLSGNGRFGDSGIIRALIKDPLGIGYSNQIYAYGLGDIPPAGTIVLPIDLNGNKQAESDEILDTRQKATAAVASGLYPAPPSRILYLVTNGKPDGIVQVFIEWVLLEGQDLVDRLGYVQLSSKLLDSSLQKIR
ncbi:MAG: substrate-binding domain-containing protein [Anaerolineales bacterium]|nr:substrate-binding domain-containing protein [Anaerolineales bacterium]